MIRVLLFVFTVSVVTSLPINNDAQMMDLGDIDTALVESTIREVRAAPDSEVIDLLQAGTKGAYLHKYGDDGSDDNIHGFHRRHEAKGSDGYKHFDSFHKKDGDKYGYEKHSAYGKAKKNNYDSEDDNAKNKKSDGENAKYEDEAASGEETKKTYQVVEEIDGDIDDGPAHYTGTSGDYTESARGSDDSGESAHYTNDDGNNGDSYHYTSPYTYEGNANAEEGNYDDGNYTGHYSATANDDDNDNLGYTASGESEHYTEEGTEDDN